MLLEHPEEALDTAIAFGLANENRRRFKIQETDFILEVVAHELQIVIVPESEAIGGTGPEAAKVLVDALAEVSRASKLLDRLTA